jgi:hypothetical protein
MPARAQPCVRTVERQRVKKHIVLGQLFIQKP